MKFTNSLILFLSATTNCLLCIKLNTRLIMNRLKATPRLVMTIIAILFVTKLSYSQNNFTFPVVDTDQHIFYDTIHEITEPAFGDTFYGQDASYTGNTPSYIDNGDGTVSDLVTGLMWQKSPDMDSDGDIDYDDKMSYDEAMAGAASYNLAGYTDWRLPSIKEMYSLILFSGVDPSGYNGTSTEDLVPFLNTDYFDFAYGDQNAGERIIDAQMASSNLYVGTTMMGDETMFGVNFADGRIKGYPTGPMPGQSEDKQFYVMYVRGNTDYGINDFEDNGNGTITDHATGLMWIQNDDGEGMVWENALSYAENFQFAGSSNWRLPNAKELQSIVDYSRSLQTTNSAAIDPLFNCSTIIDEGGEVNYPFYWTGTTHASWQANTPGSYGAYVCFGEALGFMEVPPNSGNYQLLDVHGAGAQRSDPKVGDPANWPYGHGPQGDVIRIYNYVRLVRDADTSTGMNDLNLNDFELNVYPNPASDHITIDVSDNFSGTSTIQIYNLLGGAVYSESKELSTSSRINISKLNPGIYFLTIQSEGHVYTKKFTVK